MLKISSSYPKHNRVLNNSANTPPQKFLNSSYGALFAVSYKFVVCNTILIILEFVGILCF